MTVNLPTNKSTDPLPQPCDVPVSLSSRAAPVQALLNSPALAAFQHREFRLLWYGQVFTSMATWMDSIARGWLMYDLTHSSFQLGLVRGVQAVPTLLLSPIAGSVADLYSRKNQIVISQTANGLLYTWMAAMIFTGAIEPWHVYVTSLGLAAVQTFQQPARVAMVSDTVPQANLSNALALNAVVFNSARSAGPALAGLFIAMYGTGGSYSMQGLFYFMATIWTCMLRNVPIQQPAHGASHAESFGRTIIEGWKFSWRTYEVRISLLVVSLAMFLLIPFTTLLPVYARDILNAGAKGQGLLLTCMGIGALFSSVVVAAAGDRLPRGIVIIGGVGIYGLLVTLFAASTWFPLSMFLMLMIGFCHVTSHALIQIVIQAYSPAEMRGRTMAIFHMTQVILVIGAMFIGALAEWIGARWALTGVSLIATLLMLAIYLFMPKARRIH
jgi:MFS family permease